MTITIGIPYTEQYIQSHGITLHTIVAGPQDGEPIVLLHGFPEFWYGWHQQIPALVEAGYRVIVPDQRGYNLSDKPHGVKAYHLNELTKDIIGLIDSFGYKQVYLVGHDWGAAVSWWLAEHYPDRFKKLVIMNVPYPLVVSKATRSGNLAQLRKSWYIFYFQLPFIPERSLLANDMSNLVRMMYGSGKEGTFSPEDIEHYKKAWSQPGAIKAMINWYRAALRVMTAKKDLPQITVPTLMLWGENDIALGKELAQPSIDLCEDGQLIFFPEATHWVQHDEAGAVNQAVLDFFSQ